ncbi:MAG: DUF928 domain-containing protein [Filimonas sp.]|nr:DUF928 domain-containing protein [Filimonas sp.]
MSRYIFIVFFLLITSWANSQVTIQFSPEIYGKTVDGLFSARYTNGTAGTKNVDINISVTEQAGGALCNIQLTAIQLLPGSNILNAGQSRKATIHFSNTDRARLAKQTSYLPGGAYSYCFEVSDSKTGTVLGENCFDADLTAISAFTLISPADQETICDNRPLFTWQPLVPSMPGTNYQLVLCEIKEHQTPEEALNYNLPLINQPAITSPLLIYPSNMTALEKKKKYAWQVSAYREKVILQRSEVWIFKYGCEDSIKGIDNNGFRDIEDLAKGNFYIADGIIKFALQNPYAAQILTYHITGLSQKDAVIKHLPTVKLRQGTNNIVIDISENKSFVDSDYYQLTVIMPNGETKKLRFQYKKQL